MDFVGCTMCFMHPTHLWLIFIYCNLAVGSWHYSAAEQVAPPLTLVKLQSKWMCCTWSSVLLLCIYIGRMGVLFCYCILLPPLRLEFAEKDGFLELYNISFPHLDHSPSLPYNFKKQSNSQNASSRSKTFSSNREPLRPRWQTPQVPS